MEDVAVDLLARGGRGAWEVKEPVEAPALPCRWEMQPGSTRLPHHQKCWKKSAGCVGCSGMRSPRASERGPRERRTLEAEGEPEA